MRSAIPWVVVGVGITALLSAAELPLDYLSKYLRTSGRVLAALVGLATPLCSCGALPVAIGLSRSGVSMAVVVAFLTASQSAGLDSAAITVGLLGWSATLCRLVGAVVLAVCASFAVPSRAEPPPSEIKASDENQRPAQPVNDAKTESNFVYRLVSSAVTNAKEVFPMVILGLAVSTAMRLYLPALTGHADALGDQSSQSWARALFTRAFVLVSALPLQLCEHTTVTLAAGIQKAGGSPGLAFAFLLSAPATNVPTLLLLLRTQRREKSSRFATARVVLALAAASIVLSYAVDSLGIDMLVQQEAKGGGGSAVGMPKWIIKASPWIAGLLSIAATIQSIRENIFPGANSHHAHHADSCCQPEEHEKQD